MRFEIRPSPLLPPFGGLPDEHPGNFIATGELGLRGAWVHESDVFVAVLKDEDTDVLEVADALHELARPHSPEPAKHALSSGEVSYGHLVLQEHRPGTIRVEFGVEVLRAREIGLSASPCHDPTIELALGHWLSRHGENVAKAVRDRSSPL